MKQHFQFLATIVLALILTGCAQPTPEAVSFTIEMTEYAFTPSTIEVVVGQQVTLNLVNKGALEHEIMFGRDVKLMDNRPNGYMVDMFEQAGIEPEVMLMGTENNHMDDNKDEYSHASGEDHEHKGFMVFLAKSGDQASMTFTVTKDMVGEWEMGCFELEGVHYSSGMTGKFIVKP